MKKEYQDRIDDYLLNRMSETERHAFERELECDEELCDQLMFTKAVQQALADLKKKDEKTVNKWLLL